MVKRYGSDEILAPHGFSGALAVGIPVAAFALAAVAIGVTLFRGWESSGTSGGVTDGEDLAIVSAALADRRGSP